MSARDAAAATTGPTLQPFTMIGSDGAACVGDVCAIPGAETPIDPAPIDPAPTDEGSHRPSD